MASAAKPGSLISSIHSKIPTVLTDSSGASIVPTAIPPTTDFPSNPRHNGTLPSESHSNHQKTSHLDQKRNTEATDYAVGPAPALERADSAPSRGLRPSIDRQWQTERPQPPPRRGTVRRALNRHSTEKPSERRAMSSSDSDSSSSESDDDNSGRAEGPAASVRPQQGATRGQSYNKFAVGNDQFESKGKVSKRDGRLNISVNETGGNGYMAKALGQSIQHHLNIPGRHDHGEHHKSSEDKDTEEDAYLDEAGMRDAASVASSIHSTVKRPRLNIVVMVIGSRGDIQPFLQVGRVLKRYGHRVRIATHPAFKSFVEKDVGLEFFSIGGDPSELMAFMVKNPGLIPSLDTIREGEIARRRKGMAEMFEGFWRACTNSTDDEKDKSNMKMLGDKAPFIADAIIANPPSFAHVHIAERLGIPLHIMFTFPYSPTQQFPHPLANVLKQKSNVDPNYANFMSYPLVELMTWQGLGDLVNRFREKTLGLEPVSSLWAPGALFRMKVPYTYMWSPALVPKPKDWGPEIDIGGYVFLDLASSFEPPKELTEFLDAGEPPVYIGFGSIVVDDPDKFTKLIFDAVKMAGVRALVSKGWGGLGDDDNTPDNIFMLENTPHDWLFPKVSAVVHHGGAGTAAIGLKCAKPTMVVPFFGDQPFWGAMISEAKAGAHESIPYKKLTAEKLAEGIKQCLTQEARDNVQKIADSISNEGDGAENAVKSFHRSLPFAGHNSMRCSILEDRVAVWKLKHSHLRLSALAADMLVDQKRIRWKDLRLLRHYEWNDFDGPGEPISGIGGSLLKTGTGFAKGIVNVPSNMTKHIKKREAHDKKKKEKLNQKEEKRKAAAAASAQAKEGEEREKQDAGTPRKTQRPQAPARAKTTASAMSADPWENLAQELAGDAGRGLQDAGGALVNAPLDLGIAIAQGFHNAPRLYGDGTVRKPTRITGMHSGAKAARKELVYGVYDGWSGLVTQPYHGYKDARSAPGRLSGFGKGLARGIGGFVLKDISAIITPPLFLVQGAKKEMTKRMGGPGTIAAIRRAHIVQGQKDYQALRDADKEQHENHAQDTERMVDDGWRIMQETWDAQEEHIKQHGGSLRGRLSVRREKQKWLKNGALENVGATSRALETQRQGKSLDQLFAERRKEMELAQQPRAPAMDQPDDYETSDAVGPNGHYKRNSAHPGKEHHKQQVGGEAEAKDTGAIDASGVKNEDSRSDTSSTAVGSPDEDFGGKDNGHTKDKGVDRMQDATDQLDRGGMDRNADRTQAVHA